MQIGLMKRRRYCVDGLGRLMLVHEVVEHGSGVHPDHLHKVRATLLPDGVDTFLDAMTEVNEVRITRITAVPLDHPARGCSTCVLDMRDREIADHAEEVRGREGEIEFDADAVVSHSEDNGAYVLGWIWVDFDGTKWDKRVASEGGDDAEDL